MTMHCTEPAEGSTPYPRNLGPGRPCAVPGCPTAAEDFGIYCNNHHQTNRKNGDPLQRSLRAGQLSPYIPLIQGRYERMPVSPMWDAMQRRWLTLVNHATLIDRHAQLRPHNKYEAKAAREILKLHREQPWERIMFTGSAMFVMRQMERGKFKSDKAFIFQLQRQVRMLGDTSSRTTVNKKTGRTQKMYAYFPPKAAEILGQWLAETFGVLGLRICELETKHDEIVRKDREAFTEALRILR